MEWNKREETQRTPLAASSITLATASGCEMYTAWLALISVTLEPARWYIQRCRSGLSAWSSVVTTAQLGLLCQAATCMVAPKAAVLAGTCDTAMKSVRFLPRSPAKSSPNFRGSKYRWPSRVGTMSLLGEGIEPTTCDRLSPTSGCTPAT